MGHTQSSEESPDTVRIDKTAVPDSFDVVHVSDGVVDRVGTTRRRPFGNDADGDAQKLQDALQREREVNENLRREMLNLRNSAWGSGAPSSGASSGRSSDRHEEEEERKRTFQEAVERVSARFFNNMSETACAGNAQQVLKCYTDNLKQPLRCSALAQEFQQCVADYRTEMLARNG